jgi:hypothetical protein
VLAPSVRPAAPLITRLVVDFGLRATRQEGIDANRRFFVTPPPMALLSSGVPLTLLLDLVLGPNSEDLLNHELLSDIAESYE